MHPKSNKKTIAINTGLLAYTFSKLGDNPTNNEGDNTNCKIQLNYVKYIALSANVPSGLKIENLRSSKGSRETIYGISSEGGESGNDLWKAEPKTKCVKYIRIYFSTTRWVFYIL